MDRVSLSNQSQAWGGNLPFELYVSGSGRLACHSWLGSRYYYSFYAIHITNPAGNI